MSRRGCASRRSCVWCSRKARARSALPVRSRPGGRYAAELGLGLGEGADVPGWLEFALIGWVVAVALICAILTAAKRADVAAGVEPPPARLPLVTLERLAQELRVELAVDQVLIVVCEKGAPGRAVAVAGAGVSASVLGASLATRDSVAAAVAVSGMDALVAGHGSLDGTRAGDDAVGDAAAVALALPAGAIAVARLDAARPLTPADALRLRALLRRRASRFRRAPGPQRAGGGAAIVPTATPFARPDRR